MGLTDALQEPDILLSAARGTGLRRKLGFSWPRGADSLLGTNYSYAARMRRWPVAGPYLAVSFDDGVR